MTTSDEITVQISSRKTSIVRLVVLIAGLLAIVALMKLGAGLIAPFFLLFFLALLVVPLYQKLKHRGLSSGISLLIMLAGMAGIAIFLGLLLAFSFRQLLESLNDYDNAILAQLDGLVQWLEGLNLDASSTEEASNALFQTMAGVASGFLKNLVALAVAGLAILVALAFIMIESSHYPERLQKGLGENNVHVKRMRLFQRSIYSYVLARIKLNLLTGVGVTVMLLIFGVDFALLWGVLAFLLSFIPYIGLVLASIPAILLATAESGLVIGIIVALGYLVINQLIEQVAAPKIIGDDIALSPALMFISLIFWAWMFGTLGALLAGPLAALMIVIMASFDDTRWLAILFSADDSPLVTGEMNDAGAEQNEDKPNAAAEA
ncbi:MAG: AI-2E family transporter [Chloroflexota bacterium]|nr:AI-2E family transporter [Chloroflexota bacterium]